MTNQYTNIRDLKFGSADVRVALYTDTTATMATATSVGMLDGIKFSVSGDEQIIETDNTSDIDMGATNMTVVISASAWKNIDLDILHKLTGEIGTVTSTAGSTPVTVTDEPHVLTGTISERLANKNGVTPTLVTAITVTQDGATAVLNTDYTIGLDKEGYTTIAAVAGSTVITSGETVLVDYTYTAPASKKITFGTGTTPKYLHVWLVNTNAAGEEFALEIYKVRSMKSVEFTFGSDKKRDLLQMPISITGVEDNTRAVDDNLYSVIDEVTVA